MTLATRLLDALFVPHCPACDRPGPPPLCAPCATTLVELGPACPRCAEPLAAPPAVECARCRTGAWPLTQLVAPWRYGGELARAVRSLKFGRRPSVARDLAGLLAPFLEATVRLADIELLVPVPLHWRRLARRGFNQAEALARHARREADLVTPIVRALRRVRSTAPQTGLTAAARAKNLLDAFVVPPRHAHRIAGRRVILIDDVVTTGATMASAARALLAGGAAEVVGFALARAEA